MRISSRTRVLESIAVPVFCAHACTLGMRRTSTTRDGKANMAGKPKIEEKYERNGWPAIKRPDVKPPEGWSLELVVGVHRVRHQRLSPDGRHIAFIWDRDDLSDVYVMPAAGGWPQRISMDRSPAAFWDDEFPEWSPDCKHLAYTNEGHVYV
ncbi:MAG: hypothetical protein EHM65_11200, partial [Acidobacteriales bacterium]